jgi:hypothetical protein
MGWAGITDRGLWREALFALLVLALAFLNFGHSNAVFAAGGRVVVTATSICGDPGSGPSAGEHFACHACRSDAAALPPEPCAVEPVVFSTVAIAYADAAPTALAVLAHAGGNPRAPPSI